MVKLAIATLALGIFLAPSRGAGRQQTAPQFDALQIKKLDRVTGGRTAFDPQRMYLPVATLADLVRTAYGIEPFQLRTDGEPGWVTEVNFSVQATTASPQTRAQMLDLPRSALADRFQLVVDRHAETVDSFSLTVAPGGPKFGPLAPDGPPRSPQGAQLLFSDLPGLVRSLNSMYAALQRPVVDETGLTGSYDIRLSFDVRAGSGGFTVSPEDMATHLPGALESQLGLKLKPGKTSIEVVRITHAALPAEP